MRVVLVLLLVLLGAWLVVVAAAWAFQRRLQYFPDPARPVPPAGPRWAGLREVTLAAADGTRLEAWHWPGTRDLTLLLLHGNAGHRGDRLDWMAPFHDLGWGIFLLDYRGYGGSAGRPTEEGLVQDADAAARWLAERGAGRVVYFGESLGCGVAVLLAARRPPAALVLQSGADSLVPVAQRSYPFLPVGLLMRDRFDAGAVIGSVPAPLLTIHGADDRLIPVARARALHDRAPGPKEWYEVEDAGHNDVSLVAGRAYYERVHAFLESVR